MPASATSTAAASRHFDRREPAQRRRAGRDTGSVTADARFKTPANAIAIAAMRRVRRRSASRVAGRRPRHRARGARRRRAGGHDTARRARAPPGVRASALGKLAHAVPEPGVQLGARFELDPRAAQPRHVHRRQPGARRDALDDAARRCRSSRRRRRRRGR